MSFLRRRIEDLLKMLEQGRFFLPDDTQTKQFQAECGSIRRSPDGRLDLDSCGPLLRLYASAIGAANSAEESDEEPATPRGDIAADVAKEQQEFFALLAESFVRFAGVSPEAFAPDGEIEEAIRKNGAKLQSRARAAWEELARGLEEFYSAQSGIQLARARALPGAKAVAGGSQRFSRAALAGSRSALLALDTLFIPDPILPWFERPRIEERFPVPELLRNLYLLLQLKPLVDETSRTPAIVVFGSFEKTLEARDRTTQDMVSRELLRFFGHFLDVEFKDEDEILVFARENEARFLEIAERDRLLVSLGNPGAPFRDALAEHEDRIKSFRSREYLDHYESLSAGERAATIIMEAVVPQAHLRDNADATGALPLMWAEWQWHYFSLDSKLLEDALVGTGSLSKATAQAMRALAQTRVSWPARVPVAALAELRRQGSHLQVRDRMEKAANRLHGANLEDLDRVAAEIGLELRSIAQEGRVQAEKIEQEFQGKYKTTLMITAAAGSAMAFLPQLAPVLGISAVTASFLRDKVEELRRKREAARSLTGILATAAETTKDS